MRRFLCFSILPATHPVGLRRLMAKAESLAGKSQMNTHSERLWRRGGGETYRGFGGRKQRYHSNGNNFLHRRLDIRQRYLQRC